MAEKITKEDLWVKLNDTGKLLDKLLVELNSSELRQIQTEIKPDFDKAKDEIIAEIKEQSLLHGKHSDAHFETNGKNIQVLNNNILKIGKMITSIQQLIKEPAELLQSKESYFDFKIFKIKKTSFIITVLGLLVFILTLFCMKQQNDYGVLWEEVYNKYIP
jgi:hypothetical protein